jgi:DNA mismatch repair protein MutS2
MQQELDEVRREIEQTRRQLARAKLGSAGQFGTGTGSHEQFLAEAEKEVTRRQRATEEVDTRVVRPSGEGMAGPIEVGDRVWVATLQASGEVLSLNERGGEAEVQIGNFRLKLPIKRLELRQKAVRDTQPVRMSIQGGATIHSPGMEFDMRGERVEEAMPKLERYLDDAYMARLPWVRIIHGKGTGALREAVRNLLRDHPSVAQFRNGEAGEGGDGVTVAKLVSD